MGVLEIIAGVVGFLISVGFLVIVGYTTIKYYKKEEELYNVRIEKEIQWTNVLKRIGGYDDKD